MSRLTSVLRLLLTVAATVLFAGAARAADEAHTLSVRMDWLPSGYQAPFFLAVDKGWLQKAGLDVTIVRGNGSSATVQLVGAGQHDIGHAALSSMAFARNKGMPVISIAGFFRKGDLALLVPVASPIKSPADLKGKKVVYTAASLEGPFLDSFLAKSGLSRSDVDLVNVDASAKESTYVMGSVDGVFSTALFAGQVVNKLPARAILFADYGLQLPGFGLFANEAALKKKGEAIRTFTSIIAGSWTYTVNGHEEEAVQALMKIHEQERLDAERMRLQLKGSVPFLYSAATEKQPIGIQSDADWAAAIRLMEAAKVVEPGSKPADYFTNDYLDPAIIRSVGG